MPCYGTAILIGLGFPGIVPLIRVPLCWKKSVSIRFSFGSRKAFAGFMIATSLSLDQIGRLGTKGFKQPIGIPHILICRNSSAGRSFGLTTSLDTNYDPSEKWIGLDELFLVRNIFLLNELDADWPCYSGKWTAGHRPCSLLWGGSNRSGFPKFLQSGL